MQGITVMAECASEEVKMEEPSDETAQEDEGKCKP